MGETNQGRCVDISSAHHERTGRDNKGRAGTLTSRIDLASTAAGRPSSSIRETNLLYVETFAEAASTARGRGDQGGEVSKGLHHQYGRRIGGGRELDSPSMDPAWTSQNATSSCTRAKRSVDAHMAPLTGLCTFLLRKSIPTCHAPNASQY